MLRKFVHGALIGLGVSTLFSVLFLLGFFQTWQFSSIDRISPTRPVRPDIAIIEIDNRSINQIGRFPWSREVYGKLLDSLKKGEPYAIGLDITFLEEQNPAADQALATAIANAGNVTLAAEVEGKNISLPIPLLRKNARYGIVNIDPDADGVTRSIPLEATGEDGVKYQHFSIEVLKTYFEKKGTSGEVLNNIPDENGRLRINYAAPPGSFKSYSFVDVLNGTVVPGEFKNKIVLVGASAPDLHDSQIVPLSLGTPMNGVEIHANAIQTILDAKFLSVEETSVTLMTIIAIGLLVSVSLMYMRLGVAIIFAGISIIAYVLYVIFSYDSGLIKNIVVPTLVIATTAVGDIIYKYIREYKAKQFIRKAFSYYLSEAVLAEILSDPKKLKLGGVRQEISVLFSDVAGFTSISEKINPEDLSRMLNIYLTRMTEIVFHNIGVLDKYVGDAVMAFWGAPLKEPDHAYLACKTALEMYNEMDSIKKDWEQYNVTDFDIRIGINTGEMVVGNMGSNVRFDYTLIGDNVNLGSRLEGINKEYGTKIIISQSTRDLVKDRVVVRKLDTVAVKGKKNGVTIYELRALGEPTGDDKKLIQGFEIGRALYEKGDFKKALSAFENFAKEYPNDPPTKVFIDRIKLLLEDPPRSWDGIFIAPEK